MVILLTAFEPFGGESINPALEAVGLCPETLGETQIIKLVLPVVFGRCVDLLKEALAAHRPDAVLCVGQAGGRAAITLERIAINLSDSLQADNEGRCPVDEAVVPQGPAAYFSTLPVKAIVEQLRAQGLPAALSYSAGTYVCNHLMYGLLHTLEQHYPHTRGGFMHVPYAPVQTANKPNQPSMSLEDIVRGIIITLKAL